MTSAAIAESAARRIGLVACVLALSSLVACSSSVGSSSGSTGSGQTSASYQLDPGVMALRFNADAAVIKVTAQEGAQTISVTEQSRGVTPTKEVSGTNAVLTAKCPSGVNVGDSCRVDFTVTVPPRVAVDIEGAAGDTTVSGPLTSLTVNAAAGGISGTELGAGTFQVTTKAGAVDLSFAAAPVSVLAKTDAGTVTVAVPGGDKYNVTVNTTLGSQEVAVDKDPASPHRIDIMTTVGAVTVKKR